jgi:hypothetical protein
VLDTPGGAAAMPCAAAARLARMGNIAQPFNHQDFS